MQNSFSLSLRALLGLTFPTLLRLSSEMQGKHLSWVFVKLNKQTKPQIPSLHTMPKSKHFHSKSGNRWRARKYQSKAKPRPCSEKIKSVAPRPASLAHGIVIWVLVDLVLSAISSPLYGSAGCSPLTAYTPAYFLNVSNFLVFLLYLKLPFHCSMDYDLIMSREPAPAVCTLSSLPGCPLKSG